MLSDVVSILEMSGF